MQMNLTIRESRPEDQAPLRRLAALDSRPQPRGSVLVAELEGELLAALPLGGGRPIADPFRPTAALVRLLELRASQLEDARAAGERRVRPLASPLRQVGVARH